MSETREGLDYVLLPFAVVLFGACMVVVLPFWALGRVIAWAWPNAFKALGMGGR